MWKQPASVWRGPAVCQFTWFLSLWVPGRLPVWLIQEDVHRCVKHYSCKTRKNTSLSKNKSKQKRHYFACFHLPPSVFSPFIIHFPLRCSTHFSGFNSSHACFSFGAAFWLLLQVAAEGSGWPIMSAFFLFVSIILCSSEYWTLCVYTGSRPAVSLLYSLLALIHTLKLHMLPCTHGCKREMAIPRSDASAPSSQM